ncbi:hypothetical protein [Amycolatopsis sp. BJA-103]|uniref:hypothetical protein n=1 Tax=Amycolatopsis sp. BJA-103 TaxID=1911175 RepID=UPI000C772AEB|nr:hypothetical protein [Amycolatopsis sp. BJA-103]AUI57370.1 hypothetical protein BKN51_03495 [Amycolatopsis sp. BJA-103]PNE13984.1 hypothetical protein B1H26_37080 [Amycolatopsis sp. BJA-103]
MRDVLGRVTLLVTTVFTGLLFTPATALAQCTSGLVNTLDSSGNEGCGGIYPAVGSVIAVAAALGAAAIHAALSYARGGAPLPEEQNHCTYLKADGSHELRANPLMDEFIHGDVRGDVFMKGGTIDGNVYGNVVMWDGATITGIVFGDVAQLGRHNVIGEIGPADANSIGGDVRGNVLQTARVTGTITIGGRTIPSPVR